MNKPNYVPKSEMNSRKNLIVHGVYLGLYGFVKYLPFPFFEVLRYAVIRLFAPNIRSKKIHDGVTIYFPWKASIGKNSTLNQGVIIDAFGGVSIGNGVRIASYCTINTADHDFADPDRYIYEQGYQCSSITIEDDVWIGSHVCINKGVTIGKGAVIGSGSVVTKDIPPYSIAVGSPCKTIKKR